MILKTSEPIEILDVFVRKAGETYEDRETGETKKYSKDLYECLCRFRDRAYSRVAKRDIEKWSEDMLTSDNPVEPGTYEAEIICSSYENSRSVIYKLSKLTPVKSSKNQK